MARAGAGDLNGYVETLSKLAGDWAIGLIGGAGFAAGFLARLFLSRLADRRHLRPMLGGGIAVALLWLAGMIAAERLWEFVAARVLLGLGSGCVGPAVRRVVVTRDPARAGKALGVPGVFELGGFPAGSRAGVAP